MNRLHIIAAALHWLARGISHYSSSGAIFATLCLSILAYGDTDTDWQIQSYQDIGEYWNSGDSKASLQTAERIVESLQRDVGTESIELAVPLRYLAAVQQLLGRNREAERNLNRSITIAEDQLGTYDMFLTKPLAQLGKLYFDTRRYPDALQAFRRAQHILHRNEGVYTLTQLDLVGRISAINVVYNQPFKADVQQRFYYRINQRHYGASDPDIIPAMRKMGAWFRDSGQYRKSLKIYRKMVDLILNNNPSGGTDLVKTQQAIASVLYLQGNCCPDKPLQKALNIIRADPTMDFFEEVDAIVALADMNLIKKNVNRAKTLYRLAWAMLTQNKQASVRADNLFGHPVKLGVGRKEDAMDAFTHAKLGNIWRFNQGLRLADIHRRGDYNFEMSIDRPLTLGKAELIGKPLPLCYPLILDLLKASNKKNWAEYYVDFDFTVNDVGRPTHIAIKSTNAPAVLRSYVKNMLYRTRYRPKVVEGTTVDTEHVSFRQTFTPMGRSVSQQESLLAYTSTAVLQGCNILAMQEI